MAFRYVCSLLFLLRHFADVGWITIALSDICSQTTAPKAEVIYKQSPARPFSAHLPLLPHFALRLREQRTQHNWQRRLGLSNSDQHHAPHQRLNGIQSLRQSPATTVEHGYPPTGLEATRPRQQQTWFLQDTTEGATRCCIRSAPPRSHRIRR